MFKIWSSAEERETVVVTESQILPVPLLFSCHKVSRSPQANAAVKITVVVKDQAITNRNFRNQKPK